MSKVSWLRIAVGFRVLCILRLSGCRYENAGNHSPRRERLGRVLQRRLIDMRKKDKNRLLRMAVTLQTMSAYLDGLHEVRKFQSADGGELGSIQNASAGAYAARDFIGDVLKYCD